MLWLWKFPSTVVKKHNFGIQNGQLPSWIRSTHFFVCMCGPWAYMLMPNFVTIAYENFPRTDPSTDGRQSSTTDDIRITIAKNHHLIVIGQNIGCFRKIWCPTQNRPFWIWHRSYWISFRYHSATSTCYIAAPYLLWLRKFPSTFVKKCDFHI